MSTSSLARVLPAVVVGLLLCMGMGWRAGPAFAHAALIDVEPADGAMLAVSPSRARLRFNEPVAPISVKLIDAAGAMRDASFSAHDDLIELALPPNLPVGTESISYRVISADGHPVGGVIAFSVGAPSQPHARAGDTNLARSVALWFDGALLYVTMFVGVGGFFFTAFLAPAPAWSGHVAILNRTLALAVVVIVFAVGLQGLDTLDRSFSGLLDFEVWRYGAAGTFGVSAMIACFAVCIALGGLRESAAPARRPLALAALALLGASFAATGHAATAPPVWLSRMAVFTHVTCAAIWVGALGPLALIARSDRPELSDCLGRFSRLAMWTVPLLIVAGLTLASAQFTGASDFFGTDYGQVFSAKLGGVAALLALAAVNFACLSPLVKQGASRGRRAISWTIGGEIAAVLTILGLVAAWRLTPPPRALVPAPALLHIHGEQMMAMVALSPGRVGVNRAHLDILDGSAGPLAPVEVKVALGPADQSIESKVYVAKLSPDGGFDAEGLLVNFAGAWRLEIAARIDDFTEYRLSETREFAN